MAPRDPRRRPPDRVGYGPRLGRIGTAIGAGAANRFGGISIHTATDGRDMMINDPDGWEVDEPWLWWDGPAGGNGTGGPLGNPPPGAGLPYALPAAVTRCTSIIADTLAGMPWQVYRDYEKLDVPDWIADPQAKRVDLRITAGPVPEWRLSAVEFRSSLITSMLWKGEGMIYVPVRDAAGAPLPPVWQINPDDVDIDDGRWVVGGGGAGTDGEGYTFEPRELVVIRGMMRGGLRGTGVLHAHIEELRLGAQMRAFAGNMLRAGIPNGYLKVNSPQLTRDKARELQRDWMRQHGGPRKKIAVLNATTEFHPLSLDPAALQLAEMRDFSNLDWALAFGVPPYMVGVRTDSNTYANVTSRMVELAEFTLLPWSRRLESGIDAEFPRGTELRINLDGLRRADTLTRYQAHKLALDGGWMTVDEVRELENLPPMEQQEQLPPLAGTLAASPALLAAAAQSAPPPAGATTPAEGQPQPPQLRALGGGQQ